MLARDEIQRLKEEYLPRILPPTWHQDQEAGDGRAYRNAWGLTVIISFSLHADKVSLRKRTWLHFSMAHKKRLPTWEELRDTKYLFLGDLKAIQVLPARKEYVNINPNVLHLFACIDGDTLPDFTEGSGSL